MAAKRKALTAEQLPKEPVRHLRQNSRDVLKKFWASIERRLEKDDPKAAELVARMYAYDKAAGGVSIYNQTVNQVGGVASVGSTSRVLGFDQIISRFEEASAVREIAAPDDEDVIDIEPDLEPGSAPDAEDIAPLTEQELIAIEELAGGLGQ